jgi:hypothetical protein
MLSTMSSQAFLDSFPQTPRTFGRMSYQSGSFPMDQTIKGTFDALDDIQFDLQPFTVQEAIREDSETLERPRFSWETSSASSYHPNSNESFDSDERSQLYICSPSSVISKSHQHIQSILPEDITGTFVNNCESLNQQVHRWLSELPDIPWLDVRCVDVGFSILPIITKSPSNLKF